MKPVYMLLAEDQLIIAEQVIASLKQLGYEHIASTTSGEEAVEMASAAMPDLIIMDIHLSGTMDGIEAVQKIMQQRYVPVIYLTDFDDKATIDRAKHTRPAAYLLKPFKQAELGIAIELALFNASGKQTAQPGQTERGKSSVFQLDDRVFIRKNDSFVRVDIADILFIKADRSYCEIQVTGGEKFTQSESMSAVEDKIRHPLLRRVHRSYIVNIDHIMALRGNQLIVGEEGVSIPMGDSYRDDISGLFNKV